jgi:hypothetical protein
MTQKKYLLIILTVFLVSSMAQSFLVVSLSNRGQKQRLTNQSLIKQTREDVLRYECLLLENPGTERVASKTRCAEEARIKVYGE